MVDDIYNALFRELITYMMEDPRNITPCTHLLFIAKNLERIGDHTTNIAETVYYAVEGEVIPDVRPKGRHVRLYRRTNQGQRMTVDCAPAHRSGEVTVCFAAVEGSSIPQPAGCGVQRRGLVSPISEGRYVGLA